jgi:hypothetical protein
MTRATLCDMPKDRRHTQRRANRLVQVEHRRREERRDYPRLELSLEIKETTGRSDSHLANLSPEGFDYVCSTPPTDDTLLVRFALPTVKEPLRAHARVVGRAPDDGRVRVSALFTDIDIAAQLAIAEWVQDWVFVASKPTPSTSPMGPLLQLTQVVSRHAPQRQAASSPDARPGFEV